MESSLTESEVQFIISRRSAVKDRIYTDKNGFKYLGLADGRLERVPKIKGEVSGDLQVSKVNNIGNFVHDSIVSNLTQVGINKTDIVVLKRDKADKSFALAMSIIF